MSGPPESGKAGERITASGLSEKPNSNDKVLIPAGGFTRKEFAALHGVHLKTIDRWIRGGKLIVTRTPGGQPRIHGVKA